MNTNITFHAVPKYKNKSSGNVQITYDFLKTEFGYSLVAVQDDKVCHISFQDDDFPNFDKLQANWPSSDLIHDPKGVEEFANKIFKNQDGNIDVLLKGTDFQVDVWKELTKIKSGTMVSYEKMAHLLGKPKAVRAVANAIARNRIAYLIPCHRVISKTGDLHKYGSGVERKRKMLLYEHAI